LAVRDEILQLVRDALAMEYAARGVPAPTPSWGQMVFEGREALLEAWWLSTFPGIAIAVTVIGFNLLGDALRDAFEPRQLS
jgi:peptide/nickel transport system permease protein